MGSTYQKGNQIFRRLSVEVSFPEHRELRCYMSTATGRIHDAGMKKPRCNQACYYRNARFYPNVHVIA
jgi:hypothetical protein